MKIYTESELRQKAEAYCSSAERCATDVAVKLRQWGADETVEARIMELLFRERYLDNARFCRFFVRDKYRFNQWGRMKIAQALRMKQMPEADIENGLEEIDPSEYAGMLKKIIARKAGSVKASSDYERDIKLIRFAMGRGFTYEEVKSVMKTAVADEDFF